MCITECQQKHVDFEPHYSITTLYIYAVLSINDIRSSDAPPPSGSASNNNIIAGTVGFLVALVVVIPLIIVSLLYLLHTRRIVIGRRAHNQTENATGTVEEYSMTEIVSLMNSCSYVSLVTYILFI